MKRFKIQPAAARVSGLRKELNAARAETRATLKMLHLMRLDKEKALALYDAARDIIRNQQDTDDVAAEKLAVEKMAFDAARQSALALALRNEVEAHVASLEVGMSETDLTAEIELIVGLLSHWPATVAGLPGAAEGGAA